MSEPTSDQTEPPFPHFYYEDAVQGKDIYNFFGNRVIEHTTSTGVTLAIKVKPPDMLKRSEADMTHYAATNGVLVPEVRGIYDVFTHKPIARALITKRAPGMPLDEVWDDLTDEQRSNIKDQLREQLALMRACTQPFIGRVGNHRTRNVYDRLFQRSCGPFKDEAAFDEWCISRLKVGPVSRWRWKRELARSRRESPSKFVLTHGDLTPRNIIVQDGIITGIIDWERSGFFPEYAEYAFAMKLGHEIEKWWLPVLEEVLEPCSPKRLKFTGLVENNGF